MYEIGVILIVIIFACFVAVVGGLICGKDDERKAKK